MSDALKEAQELYVESLAALSDQRKQIEEDLAFSDPSDPQQWDESVKAQRESDPGGKRPCLVHDQLGQYTGQVTGQIEKQPPSLHAIPVAGGADKKAAEQIDGRFRHIEHASRAVQHYARSMTSAARAGVGYLVVRPEYIDRALGWQEPRISSEPDPLKVVFDPWSTETDGSDATDGFIVTDLAAREFKRRWPKKKPINFGDLETRKNDDLESVIVAEHWSKVWTSKLKTIYLDADGQEMTADVSGEEWYAEQQIAEQMSGQRATFLREYTDKAATIKWRRMSGDDILEESEYPADWIGIVPVYGYVGFSRGRMRYCGIPRKARAPQQAYNYHISELMMPGAQLLTPMRAIAGVEALWDRAQTERRAHLPYRDFDDSGQVAAPTLIKTGSSLIDHATAAERASRDIQASLGLYQANIGAPGNETSGVAIESRKEQGESSTAHFPSHMAASLGQVGQIVMQMDARLSNTRRKAPILGVDGSAGHVLIDPEQQSAFQRGPEGAAINPSVGKYGVRVVVGASYSTQRTQTNAAFAEIMRGNKELAPIVTPFWAQTLDFPGSDKFAQAAAAWAAQEFPALKDILQPEGQDKQPDPAALAQELAQCKEALQEAIQHARDAQQDADENKARADDKAEENRIREYEAETNRLKVTGANEDQIKAIVSELVNEMLTSPAPLGDEGEQPQSHEMQQFPALMPEDESIPQPGEQQSLPELS